MQQAVNANAFIYPMTLVLVGSKSGDKANIMAVGWVSRVNNVPPYFAISINNKHLTNEHIRSSAEFSIVGVSVAQKDIADYCGMHSGRKVDKAALFELFYGQLANAPLISTAPYNIACKLVNTIELPSNTLFIGEAIEAYVNETAMTDGKPDMRAIDPLIFTMPDLRYWTCGGSVGKAWSDGATFKR